MIADDSRLQEEISFQQFLAIMPRLVLRSRTRFSSFLARTFSIPRAGSCPSTAVFPIPVPFIGIFGKQGCPKLTAKGWKKLRIKRTIHILVIALNYIHAGCRPVESRLLGRSPSHLHLAVYRRLRALLAACDRPDSLLKPPGRSGPELIARLVELEKFAASEDVFNPDLYSGASDKKPSPAQAVGRVRTEHRFVSSEEFNAVSPYRSLNADRLKLSGTGQWPLADYLEDVLWLPFVEPRILQHGRQVDWEGPDMKRESKNENEKLCRLWDARGLLALFTEEPVLSSRVFNAHKNEFQDRQIGDRRWMNGAEMHPTGPSALLPSGPNMTSIHCKRSMKLIGCASDRKDFYHQAKVTRARAFSNVLPFAFDADHWRGTEAFEEMVKIGKRPFSRDIDGDRYGMNPKKIIQGDKVEKVYGGFKSLFQGDHLGVEYALSAHSNLLRSFGLLGADVNVLRHHPFPKGPMWQGLVIDDFFCISREQANVDNLASASVAALVRAEEIYTAHQVLGSDDKTVRGAEVFKVIGAEFLSDAKARDNGVILVGAPAAKRIPMALLSLEIAKMPIITKALAARLAGNWVSIFMFRRPLSCLLSEIFHLGPKAQQDSDDVVRLDRRAADELVLSGVFSLLALTDVSAEYDKKIYATDASMSKGAFTSLVVDETTASTVWLSGDRKGCYTLLDNHARQILRATGHDLDEAPVAADWLAPQKALDFAFDVVEVCGGSGVLSDALAKEGLRVCTPIDLSHSQHFNLEEIKLIDWIFQMIFEGRFRGVVVEPVCTTFSAAQHPASRSYNNPLGFDRQDRKTYLGNLIAFRCLAILWFSFRYGELGLLEQPLLSKMAWLRMWAYLLKIGLSEAHIDSCAFGSPHRKPFRLLGHGLDMESLNVRCPGGHHHVRIQGKFTKTSAIYHPGLAAFLAKKIAEGLRRGKRVHEAQKPQLESVILNDILLSEGWEVEAAWIWERPAHINILESRAYVGLLRHLVIQGGDRRFSTLLDSRVAKGAHAKGRTTARALRPSLQRACAYSIAGNLHSSFGFAPHSDQHCRCAHSFQTSA